MRVLCTGDIHLGRPISQIPSSSHLAGLSSSAAWRAIVDLAVDEQVDLVAVSGDLVDLANRYYEAIGAVEAGVRRLAAAGIPIVAVAGNHDYSVLPRIVDRLDGAIQLIGRDQQWRRWSLVRDGKTLLHVDGWSFRQEHVSHDPLESYNLPQSHDAPVLGLLHADLDGQELRYAPVRLRRLQQLPISAWLLGHIHGSRLQRLAGAPPVLYPGSPYALDPGETGMHGVWMLTIEPGVEPHFEQRAIAPVRYEPLAVDVTDAESQVEATDRIERSIETALRTAKESSNGAHLELLLVRLLVTGSLPVSVTLDASEMDQMQRSFNPTFDGATAAIERIADLTTPAIELEALATGIDAPATIARLILTLQPESTDPAKAAIVAEARKRAQTIARQSAFQRIDDPLPDDDALAATIEHEAWSLLRTLLAQKGAA